jgi:hypothetical protein
VSIRKESDMVQSVCMIAKMVELSDLNSEAIGESSERTVFAVAQLRLSIDAFGIEN